MNNRIDAIYARQSIDKKDSISIESQIEFCKYELRGGSCREYQDKGYSGKNTDRPQFQMLVEDIKRGLIARVVVYKFDRISRSILDFANMMVLFQEYNVEFISSTEKFDTTTPMGRAMLNICIVFAQLERETIQKRVQDAWYARCQRGFKMGGRAPCGFRTEPIIIDGIHTKKLVIEPTEAAFVRKMYDMYIDPRISLHDIATQLTAQGVRSFYGKPFSRSTISLILRNPIYAMADLDIYEFSRARERRFTTMPPTSQEPTDAITIAVRAILTTSTNICKARCWCWPPARASSRPSCGFGCGRKSWQAKVTSPRGKPAIPGWQGKSNAGIVAML